MNIGLISKRYAKALLEYAQEMHQEKNVFSEMKTLEKVLRYVPEFSNAMNNPVIGSKAKLQLLQSAVKNPSDVYLRFMQLVLKNRREGQLLFIVLRFEELYRESLNINSGVLITAVPADPELVEKIKSFFTKIKSGELELTTVEDPSLKGGFIFDFDTYRLDASVRTQLRSIRRQFVVENSKRG